MSQKGEFLRHTRDAPRSARSTGRFNGFGALVNKMPLLHRLLTKAEAPALTSSTANISLLGLIFIS